MIGIIIADDHPIIREGIKKILEMAEDIRVVEEVDTAEKLLDEIRLNSFDVVLLDISLPGRSGLDVLQTLKNERPFLPVLMVSMHAEELYAVRSLKAGASGYITKNKAPHELINAIRRVSSGGKYISPELAETLAGNLEHGRDLQPHELLSGREYEVLRAIASGKTVGDIARDLGLGVTTISTYRARILEKMNMTNTPQLIRYAISKGLIE